VLCLLCVALAHTHTHYKNQIIKNHKNKAKPNKPVCLRFEIETKSPSFMAKHLPITTNHRAFWFYYTNNNNNNNNNNMSIQATRRITVLSSHINPTRFTSDPHSSSLSVSLLSSQTQQDCIFCNIIRGQSPALKVFPFFCNIID
jgi:predicted 2-oxoglutarate/Fe(II)-dependent dioxygenase YbiX